ncbi:MAG TPA: Mur ligase domain-containing protein, partial [Vicinamibacterales bacterium]|nr:Mur ligase domain-containing protein [Vicinamibacterales bacterium]
MTLSELVSAARTLAPDARARVDQAGRSALAITGVTHDSRAVSAGTVFVAVRGQRADGATFATEAVRRGAAAIVAETAEPPGMSVPWLRT